MLRVPRWTLDGTLRGKHLWMGDRSEVAVLGYLLSLNLFQACCCCSLRSAVVAMGGKGGGRTDVLRKDWDGETTELCNLTLGAEHELSEVSTDPQVIPGSREEQQCLWPAVCLALLRLGSCLPLQLSIHISSPQPEAAPWERALGPVSHPSHANGHVKSKEGPGGTCGKYLTSVTASLM